MMYAVAGTVTNSLFRASVSAARVPIEIIITLLVTSSAWHAASANTFFRLVSIREVWLLDADIHPVEHVGSDVGEFHGLLQLAPFEFATVHGELLLAVRSVEHDVAAGYRNQHAASCVEFGGFAGMQDQPGDEHAFVVDDQRLIRTFARRIHRAAGTHDLGIDNAVHTRTRIRNPVRLRFGRVSDEISLADGTLAARHRLGTPVLGDGRRRSDVDEYAVVVVPVIERLVSGFELHVEKAHVRVLELQTMARLLLDRHRLCGGARNWDERGDERKRNQAATKHFYPPPLPTLSRQGRGSLKINPGPRSARSPPLGKRRGMRWLGGSQ